MKKKRDEAEQERLGQELSKVIADLVSNSHEVQDIVYAMHKKGYKPNIWLSVYILLSDSNPNDTSLEMIDYNLSAQDIKWLRSINIDANNKSAE
ncbi:hypothetical protein JW979_14935 [bacterium]|nr:hypothetical protein [candidate division CSSED10-310 bacterium]